MSTIDDHGRAPRSGRERFASIDPDEFSDEVDTAEQAAPSAFNVPALGTAMVFEGQRPVKVWVCTDTEAVVHSGEGSTIEILMPAGGSIEIMAAALWVRAGDRPIRGLYQIG